jgi:two-component system, NarL family, response regulator DevR
VAIRVFLVDDHEVVRRGVRDLLEAEDDVEVVGEAGTVEEALSRIPPTRPDVAVLDVRLPDGDGVELCREIRSNHPEIQALMLTSFDDDEALFNAMMAGAGGYVLKQVRGSDLIENVRKVASGQSTLDPSLTTKLLDRLRRHNDEDEEIARLTEQERRILELLAQGLTNRQIAEQLYISTKTAAVHVSNILAKTGTSSRTEAATWAIHAGVVSDAGAPA